MDKGDSNCLRDSVNHKSLTSSKDQASTKFVP
jgi:hypothetical protein